MSAASTDEVLRRFNQVFLDHDPAPLAGLVDEHCVIEGNRPAPDGARYVGREACVARWTEIATAPGGFFISEDISVMGDRGIMLWRYHWGPDKASSVRGVNLMRVKDGRIVEALGYVKAG
jgi:SnoaL-like domain